MANQMIAMGVRGPQLPNLGNIAQQFSNVMASTATARERQGAAERAAQFRQLVGSEGFDPGNPEHIRAAAALDPAGAEALGRSYTQRRAADQTFDVAEMARLRDLGIAVNNAADPETAYQSWLAEVDTVDPRAGAMFRQAAPTYRREFMDGAIMQAEQYINKNIATPTASLEYDAEGNAYEATVGGQRGATVRPAVVGGLPAAPAGGGVGGPDPEQRDPAAAPTGLTAQPGETPGQMMDRGIPAENIPMGSPTLGLTPASAGGMAAPTEFTLETAPQIIQDAVQNRVIGQANFEQLRNMVGPEHDRALAAWMQQNQIRIQPTGEAATPGMRSAEYRVGEGAPAQFQQVQSNAVGTQFRGAPRVPQSANVPIERVAEEAAARRPSPAEAGAVARAARETPAEAAARSAASAAASARATAEVTRDTETRTRNRSRSQVSEILAAIRRDYDALNRMEAIPSTTRGGVANVLDYVGASRLGREAQSAAGTRASTRLNTIANSRQLLATAIKNATGMSAQQMNSNIELQLLLESLSDPTQGYEAAVETIRRIESLYGDPNAASNRARPRGPASAGRATSSGVSVERWSDRRR